LLSPFILPLAVAGLAFAAFSLARLAVLVLHADDFTGLRAGDVVFALVRGLRFDAAAICPVFGLPLFLLMLPAGDRWRRFWGWTCYVLLGAVAFVLAADVLYFGTVHRHAGLEASEPGDAFKVLTTTAALQYALPLLGFLAAVAGFFFAWRRFLRRDATPWPRRGAQVGVAVAAAVLMYFGERGTLSGKRLRMVHAFQDTPAAAAHLALNGPYCILHSLVHSRTVKASFYPWAEAVRTAQESILTPGESAPDPEYPLLRSRAPRAAGRPNVVVVLLESWDAGATDAHRRELGLPPLGCTPNYDAAAKEGLLFSRFYACGQRSMDGLGAMLCGFPNFPGTPYLGRGLEQSSLTSLARLARQEGYDTWFIMSAERDSFRIDAIAGMTGFEHYLGAEDIPPAPPAEPRTVLRGACWDHEMFAEANRRLSSAKRPFLAFLYTASTHHPFFWAGDRWGKRPATGLENRYLNSLEYGDWALGEFFRAAKAADWYDRTIFVLTADHIGGPGYAVNRDDPATLHHTPGLILGPGVTPGVNRHIGSQLDVVPTIADLAGWGSPQATLGTSLFADPAAGRGALCVEGNLVLRVEEGGFVLHSLADRVRSSGPDADGVERRLLSIAQAAYTLLRTNRMARRE
jgi:phosphoglycerol transferase MdoB-like AlkP superfamily enzyme